MRTHIKLIEKIADIKDKRQKILMLALGSVGLVFFGMSYDMIMFVISGMMLASYSIGLKIGWGI